MDRKVITVFSALVLGLIVTVSYQLVVINELTDTMAQQEAFNGQVAEMISKEKTAALSEKLVQEKELQLAQAE